MSELSPIESRVLSSVQGLFKSSQRWKPEAVAIGRGQSRSKDLITTLTCVSIGLHAGGQVPIRRTGFLGRHKLLDIEAAIDTDKHPKLGVSTDWGPLKHPVFFVDSGSTPQPVISPFRLKRQPQEGAETAYYQDSISIDPFYYTERDGDRYITGEDPSRMIFQLYLGDTREHLQKGITEKLARRDERLAALEKKWQAMAKEIHDLRALSDDELVAEDRQNLEALNQLPEPFLTRTGFGTSK